MAVDSLWDKTVLLLPLSEDLQDVKKHGVVSVGGVTLSSAVGTPFGAGYALALDGTDDYLYLADSADWNFGQGDFTIEQWARFTSHTSDAIFISQRDSASTNHSFSLAYITSGSLLRFTYSTDWSTQTQIDRAWTPNNAVWYFLSVVRSGTVLQIRVDGVQLGADYTIGTNTIYNSTSVLRIGATNSTPGGFFPGYFGPIRITKAARTITAAPTTLFPRPTISGHVYDAAAAPVAKTILVRDRSTQKFLGGANSDPTTGIYTFYPPDFGECQVIRVDELVDPYTDECVFDLDPSTCLPYDLRLNHENTGRLLTFYGDTVIASDGVSFTFDGGGDCIVSTSSNYILGTDDFSVELEVYPINGGRTNGSYNRLLQIGPNTTAGTLVINSYSTNNPMTVEVLFYDTAYRVLCAGGGTTLANSTWHKLRLKRVNGVFTTELNGAVIATSGTTAYNIAANLLSIGANTANAENFYGRIGKVRINRGARRAAAAIPTSRLLKLPGDGGSVENAIIYDRVIPGG